MLTTLLARSCEFACWREASGIPDPPQAFERCSARACRERSLCPELQEPRHKPALTHVVVVAARFGQYPKANRTLDTVRKIVSSQAAVLRRVLPEGSSTVLFVDNATPSPAGDVMREECARHGLRYARNDDWSAGYGYELGAWRWTGVSNVPSWTMRSHSSLARDWPPGADRLGGTLQAPGCATHLRRAAQPLRALCEVAMRRETRPKSPISRPISRRLSHPGGRCSRCCRRSTWQPTPSSTSCRRHTHQAATTCDRAAPSVAATVCARRTR